MASLLGEGSGSPVKLALRSVIAPQYEYGKSVSETGTTRWAATAPTEQMREIAAQGKRMEVKRMGMIP